MKLFRTIATFALIVTLSLTAVAQKKNKGVYLFGVSSAFTDTVAYFTTVQYLDTVSLTKAGLLPFTPNYSSQLENYLEVMQNESKQTAAIFYSPTKKKTDKERSKLMNRYRKKNKFNVKALPAEDFTFTPLDIE